MHFTSFTELFAHAQLHVLGSCIGIYFAICIFWMYVTFIKYLHFIYFKGPFRVVLWRGKKKSRFNSSSRNFPRLGEKPNPLSPKTQLDWQLSIPTSRGVRYCGSNFISIYFSSQMYCILFSPLNHPSENFIIWFIIVYFNLGWRPGFSNRGRAKGK